MNLQELLSLYKEATTVADEILYLKLIINQADKAYYIQDEPLLADVEYDAYFKELKDLESSNPALLTPDSPTQRVSGGLNEQFQTIAHIVPMLSLENSYNSEDLIAWDTRNRKSLGVDKLVYTVEPKYDGASISIIYENNQLSRGATRGDGIQGDDITTNVRQIRSVPLSINSSTESINTIEIRGEVMIKKKAFEMLNEERVKEGQNILANPRNAASGSLRMLDPEEVKKRKLFAMLYHISYVNCGADKQYDHLPHIDNHYESIQWLHKQGLSTPLTEMVICDGIEEVINACNKIESIRDEMPYELDGAVVKVNKFTYQEQLGMTSHHPRWAMAFKFQARQATSKLLDVEYQVGRTGVITPVAKIEPVALGGVVISSISLFNEDIIREKNLKKGDMVLVERAGDVIPYIVKSIPELRNGDEEEIVFPTECPVCDGHIFKEIGEVAWRCINVQCRAQVMEKMIHFASKDAMDIRSLGPSIIARFYELGLLKDILGIYHLDYDRIGTLDKFGKKSVERLIEGIEASKTQPLNRLIFGLGIRFVGERTAKTLAAIVEDSILDISRWSIEQLCTLEDVGIKVATSVYDFFSSEENKKLILSLQEAGVNISKAKESNTNLDGGILNNKTFLFTGTLSQFKRSDAESRVESLGGTILGSVSSKLNYLVVGTDAGSKLEKAKKLGTVTILSESEFLKLIEG